MPDNENSNAALSDFPLLWRWTRDTHAVLTASELASIQPLPADLAAATCDGALRDLSSYDKRHDEIRVDDTTDDPVVSRWLHASIPESDATLTLVWDRSTAARVQRALFVERWDDFWYPSSDDLIVVSTGHEWLLEMHHEGVFAVYQRAG